MHKAPTSAGLPETTSFARVIILSHQKMQQSVQCFEYLYAIACRLWYMCILTDGQTNGT